MLKKHLTSEQANFILDNISEGIFTIDKNFKITYFNNAAEQLTKIPFHKAIGRYCHDVMRTNICESNCLMKETYESGKQIRLKHVNILRPDDSSTGG